MKKHNKSFWYEGGTQIRKILFDTTLIKLERTMYLAIMLLLVKYRFQNHWSGGEHNAKVYIVN